MESGEKKRTAAIGARIGFVVLAAFCILVFVVYYVLSQNFESLLTEYSIQLVQAMTEQGVTTIEYELQSGMEEAALLADSFRIPAGQGERVVFPAEIFRQDVLRMVYVTQEGSTSSDGRLRELQDRPDIRSAFQGKEVVYGPYFNEENEYVISYDAPVFRGEEVVGVLCLEKDGFRFCELIEGIRFSDSGESYIIDGEGTDIAVSDPNHISWVLSRYNASRILEEKEDPVTRSIQELEQKGLDGETGVGTYEWKGSKVYVVYEPIPSTGWVLLAGLRQEELAAMTQSALYASVAGGPAVAVCVTLFLLLIAAVIFWIISSMKKNMEINEKLKTLANYDALTGILNRNSYHAALERFSEEILNGGCHSLACIYLDVNGLHEVNNHLGHEAGDRMLKAVSDALLQVFPPDRVYRIGGDEFVAFCENTQEQEVFQRLRQVRETLKRQGYEISAGLAWRDRQLEVKELCSNAEQKMRLDKQQFYQGKGRERQVRRLNQELEQMVLEKQDADAFLGILASEFKGVYFVDLDSDTIRHLYIPPYFEEILKETGERFSPALLLYSQRFVTEADRQDFDKFCAYPYLETQLDCGLMPEFVYQKTDGTRMKLRVLKFKTYTEQKKETLWIFSGADN